MAGEVLIKFLGDVSSFTRSVGVVQGSLAKLGTAAALGASAMGGAAIAGTVLSVKAFADFDEAMTQSLAIMGDVSESMKTEMSDAAREVGKTTLFSATEAAESYFFLASAGLDAQQSIAALPQVAAFAQAGAFDMATATDLLTDAQSALGLTSDDTAVNMENMARVSDTLVGANTLANASVQQFSEALTNKAGPAMRAIGMETEEGVAVLAAFADQGVKGSEAGTQFGIVLRDLQTKALKNADAFAAAGIDVFDANGEFNNMAEIVGDLEGALDGLSDAQRKQKLLDLGFSDKSVSALTTLLGTSDAIAGYQAQLEEMGGVTQQIADKQLEGFKAQLSLIKDRIVDVMITVGSKLAPLILAAFAKMSAAWDQHGESIKNGFRTFGAIMKDVGETAWVVIKSIFDFFRDNQPALYGGLVALGVALGIIAVSLAASAVSAIAIYLPFLAVIAAVGVLAAGLIWAYQNVDWFRASVDATWAFIKDKAIPIIIEIGRVIADLAVKFFNAHVEIGKWIFNAGEKVGAFGKKVGEIAVNVITVIGNIPGMIKDKATDFLNAGKDLGSAIIDGIIEGIGAAGDFAKGFANAIIDTVNSQIIDRVNSAVEFEFDTHIPGVGKVGVNPPDIGHIPRLAKGGFVSSPTLAIVGDTPGEGEIVAPESMLREIMAESGGGMNIGVINMNTNATAQDLVRELSFARRTARI